MMDFDNTTTANPLFAYGVANQTQNIYGTYDYSRIRLSPPTWNFNTWYTSDMNANCRLNYGSMRDSLAGVCSVLDLINVIDTSNVAAKDLDDENIIAEDIGDLFG